MFCFFIYNFLYAFIRDTGTDGIVDYEKYGYFENLGKNDYQYVLLDRKGLGDIQGEGIYPNGWSIFSNPGYLEAKHKGLLEGNRWDFNHTEKPSLMYYKWVDSFQESPGVKQFFIAEAFQKGGYIKQAIRAYYAVLVFFPKEICQTYWKTPWYVGKVALDRIYFLLNQNQEIKWQLVGARLDIKNNFDDDIQNDVFYINPGKLVAKKYNEYRKIIPINRNQITERFGNISLVKNEHAHWQMMINNKPYFIKGCCIFASSQRRKFEE